MQDLNDKTTSGTVTAAEWNEMPSEIQQVIEDAGITLSGADLVQLAKAIANMVATMDFYSDSTGAADAYVLLPIGIKEGLEALIDGARARFRPANASTGASTVNVNGLGVKDLLQEDGTAIIASDLVTTRDAEIRYDAGLDDWFLIGA